MTVTVQQAADALATLKAFVEQHDTAAPAPVVSPLSITPTLSIPETVILPGERVAAVRVRLSEPARRPLAWRWQLRNGRGTYAPKHFASQSGTVIFQPGEVERVIRVTTLADFGIGNSATVLIAWTDNYPPAPLTVEGVIREAKTRPAMVEYLPAPVYPLVQGSVGRTLIFNSDMTEPVTTLGGKGQWASRFQWGRWQASNKELAPYTDASTDPGVRPHLIVDGRRVLRAEHVPTRDGVTAFDFSASMMSSRGAFSFRYGYAELRCRIDRAQGTIPAWWLIPASDAWPPEIDIFETGYGDRDELMSSILWPKDSAGQDRESVYTTARIHDGTWHTIGFDWTPEWMVTLVDGVEIVRRPNIYREPMYMILNVAVGGIAPAPKNAGAGWHSDMTVDYVRVWQ